MKSPYPTVKVRMAFARAQAVLYEDYLAIEHLHSFGMSSEDSRTYYDEIRWVLQYRRRNWHRLAHALLWGFPFTLGVLLAVLPPDVLARAIGLGIAVPTGLAMSWSAYRFLATPRTVAAIVSSRGTVEIGTDWPRSSNPLKDAGAFFETFLKRLELVAEFPAPVTPAAAPAPPAPDGDAKPPIDAGASAGGGPPRVEPPELA